MKTRLPARAALSDARVSGAVNGFAPTEAPGQQRTLGSSVSSPPLPSQTAASWSLAQVSIVPGGRESVCQDAGAIPAPRLEVTPQVRPHPHGLPEQLRSGIERLAGVSLDDVQVHYNSARPAQVDAAAYTYGRDIYMGPGQEKHLAHEAWHSAQQKLQRIRPTTRSGPLAVNDDERLEREASRMGSSAERMPRGGSVFQAGSEQESGTAPSLSSPAQPVAQLMKLSEIDTTGFVVQGNSTRGLKVLNKGNIHISIFANEATKQTYGASLPKKNGRPDYDLLPPDQFEFDELHVTPGQEHGHEHFFYDEQGNPLLQSLKTQTASVDLTDQRWQGYNQEIAGLLRKDKFAVHKAYNDLYSASYNGKRPYPESAESEQKKQGGLMFRPRSVSVGNRQPGSGPASKLPAVGRGGLLSTQASPGFPPFQQIGVNAPSPFQQVGSTGFTPFRLGTAKGLVPQKSSFTPLEEVTSSTQPTSEENVFTTQETSQEEVKTTQPSTGFQAFNLGGKGPTKKFNFTLPEEEEVKTTQPTGRRASDLKRSSGQEEEKVARKTPSKEDESKKRRRYEDRTE